MLLESRKLTHPAEVPQLMVITSSDGRTRPFSWPWTRTAIWTETAPPPVSRSNQPTNTTHAISHKLHRSPSMDGSRLCPWEVLLSRHRSSPFLGFYVCSIGFACWLTCIALALRLGYIIEIGPMIMIEIKVARRFLDDRTLRFEQSSAVCQTTVLW